MKELKLEIRIGTEAFYKSEAFFSEYDEIEFSIKKALPKAELLDSALYFTKGECKTYIQIADKKEEILLKSA